MRVMKLAVIGSGMIVILKIYFIIMKNCLKVI